jgi:hypothetical protein
METILRNLKNRGIIIVVLLLIMVGIIIFTNRTYSATDVLGDYADFSVKNPSISIESINLETEDIFTSIEIPEETQQELIKAFKNAKFKKISDLGSLDDDYRINITLNTGYVMYLDSDKKLLYINDTEEAYEIENDSDFFKILKNATE